MRHTRIIKSLVILITIVGISVGKPQQENGQQNGQQAGQQNGQQAGQQNGQQAGQQNGQQAGQQNGQQAGQQNGQQAGQQNGQQAGQQNGQQAGQQNGQQAGQQNGQQAGQQNGQQAGQQNGQLAGQQNGQQAGQQNGQQAGQQNGQQAGQQNGQQAGQQNGQQAGQQNGQQAGQQTDQPENLKDLVNSIFTTARPPSRSGGFAQIVTPEPIGLGPTLSPQILQTNDGNRCICVPYYLCDPTNNTIKTDGEFDGFGLIDIRFDPMSCQDVLDVCCKESQTQTEPINPRPVSEKPGRARGCGIRNVGGIDFQITGNTNNEAGFGEFPWTVALLTIIGEQCLCGASLIHPSVVLTGNHCVRRSRALELKVRAGEWDTQTTKERLPYQERNIAQIISHPMYDPKTLHYDFALLIVDRPFELTDHINVICLPQQNFVSTSQHCLASGWGKNVFGKAGKYSVIMKRVPLPIVPNNQCQRALQKTRLGPQFRLKNTFICAGGEPGVDTCEGDGGAPLVCPVGVDGDNRYSQSGIVAWGIGCNENHPAVYASVATVRNWIDSQVINLGLDPSVYTY